MARRIRDGEADIGVTLTGCPSPASRWSCALRRRCWPSWRPTIRWPASARSRLSQVAAYPLALPPADSSLRQLLDTSCSRQGLNYETMFSSNGLDSLVCFAAAGGGAITFYGEVSVRSRLSRRPDRRRAAARPRNERAPHRSPDPGQAQFAEAARAFLQQLTDSLTGMGRRTSLPER